MRGEREAIVARILLQLAVLDLVGLLTAFGLGIGSWAHGGLDNPDVSAYVQHLYVSLFAVIFNLALHCIVFIYFLGTGRWVKEVALAYHFPDEPLPKLTRELKRRTYPVALVAMLLPIAAAAAGMANVTHRVAWAPPTHLSLALLSLVVNVWALWVEYRNVRINGGVIDQVMAEVERIRAEKGLPTSAEAFEQQAES